MISIVIPLYNKAQSIEPTIRCIQAQTYQDFEIVVVDGYSSDGSLEIIQRLAQEDPRIHVFMQENRHGVTPARNESIEHAQYEHIAFMDADDYWEPTYLERMVQLIEDYPQCGIWGIAHGTMVGEEKVESRVSRVERRESRGECRESSAERGLLSENPWKTIGCPYWTSATAISKTAFDAVGGFDNRIIYGEDIDLWWRIMLQFPAAWDGTQTLAYYRVDAENRACEHVFPLKIHIPYYIGKYAKSRELSEDFRQFFDLQMLYRLFPYCFSEYKHELKPILQQIDWALQKKSMYWRFRFPHLYRLWQNMRGRKERQLEAYSGGY